MQTTAILYVGHDDAIAESLRTFVAGIGGCHLESVTSESALTQRLRGGDVGMLVAHVSDSSHEVEAVSCLSIATRHHHTIPVVVLCDRDNPALRLHFLQLGALDCLSRPLNLSRLGLLIDLTASNVRFRETEVPSTECLEGEHDWQCHDGFVFATPYMAKLIAQARAVAPLDTTILLIGETGTGKTTLAGLIHRWSPRRNKPFVNIQCGAMPPTLMESELFGHLRGTFTGADRDRAGKLTQAKDGTVLLDEVDCISFESQSKLLGVVENRFFEPLGSTRPQALQARLIVAANRSLEEEVAAGRFRADLFYRLNVVSLTLPPLRDQKQSIQPLTDKFLIHYCQQTGKHIERLTARALAALKAYDWPGNIRELRNVVERAVVLCTGKVIDVDDLTEPIRNGFSGSHDTSSWPVVGVGNQLSKARVAAEVKLLKEVLRNNNNNRTQAAMALGVSRMTLFKKLRLHKLG